MNMFKPTKAKTVKEYIGAIEPDRRKLIESIDALIRKTAPSLERHFAYNMIGYGSFPYRNYKNEPIQWPVVSLASQKNYVSLYVCAVQDGKYLAESRAKDLGNVSVGKSCIRIKKLEDVNMNVLKEVLKAAEKNPGLAGAYEKKSKSQTKNKKKK